MKDLDGLRDDVEFPQYNWKFDQYKCKLRGVIEANFDSPVVRTLVYDDDSQKFALTIDASSMLAGSWADNCDDTDKRTRMTLARNIEIDPQQPMGPQIKAAVEAVKELSKRHQLLSILLNEHLGKQ